MCDQSIETAVRRVRCRGDARRERERQYGLQPYRATEGNLRFLEQQAAIIWPTELQSVPVRDRQAGGENQDHTQVALSSLALIQGTKKPER